MNAEKMGALRSIKKVSGSGLELGSLPLSELISLLLLTEFSFLSILKMALVEAVQHHQPLSSLKKGRSE